MSRVVEWARHLVNEGLVDGIVDDDDIVSPHEPDDDEVSRVAEFFSDEPDDEVVDPKREEILAVMAEDIDRGRGSMPPGCYHHRDNTYLLEYADR